MRWSQIVASYQYATVQGSNPGGGKIFRTCTDRPWGPPSFLYNGYRAFPGDKQRTRRNSDTSPPSSAVVIKEQSYTFTPSMGRMACTEPQCLKKGALYMRKVTATQYIKNHMTRNYFYRKLLQTCGQQQYDLWVECCSGLQFSDMPVPDDLGPWRRRHRH